MIQKNDRVRVKRDIFRLPEWKLAAPVEEGFFRGSQTREHILYAKEGEEGVVLELFHWSVKVLIEGEVKTFRLTSLEKLQPGK